MLRVALESKSTLGLIIHAFVARTSVFGSKCRKLDQEVLILKDFFSFFFSVDSFLIKTKFVGLVDRITIEHDNTGILPDWNLDKVPNQINNFEPNQCEILHPPPHSKTRLFSSHLFVFEPST